MEGGEMKVRLLDKLLAIGVIGIIRVQTAEGLLRIAQALREGGLCCVEITMNTPGGTPSD